MGRLILVVISAVALYLYYRERWHNSPLYTFDDIDRVPPPISVLRSLERDRGRL